MRPLLVLRPEPGASATAARARALGLEPVVAPLFTVAPAGWEPPAEPVEAVMLTSANAVRHGGARLRALAGLRCYAVGGATAAAAREAGFGQVIAGDADGAALVARAAADGVASLLHLCGREHVALEHPEMRILRRIVYAADAVAELPVEARAALDRRAVALLHSPRAAAAFARLAGDRSRIAIAAISPAAAEAAGPGWAAAAAAAAPSDQALLEVAVRLCQTDAVMEQGR